MMKKFTLLFALSFHAVIQLALAQPNWTNNDYKKALWMTTRFYGAQRSGTNNWVLYNHLPAGVNAALTGTAFRADQHTDGTDLSGGWHDCGDHVKFGQTQFYAAYLLLKGYAEFPTGYDDKYSFAYDGYKASGQWNYEGTGHDPNCIPDVLDEMKHETDFLIKCIPNASNFYWQVGNGGAGADHAAWETATKLQTRAAPTGNGDNGTPGTRRPACKNPNDASMASFCGATLALMARVYAPYDAAYANLCLTHAVYAYNYASTRTANTITNSCFGGFYGANRDSRDAYACLLSELYQTTGTMAYRTAAIAVEPAVNFNGGWSFDYANNGEIGLYCLAQIGIANATTRFNNRITGHYLAAGSRNGNGVYTAYGTWGRLRYNGNAAFLIALYSKLNNNTTAAVINAIHNDVDYIMGKNSNKRSYIVGFEPAAGGPFIRPLKPHHRNVYLRDDNPANTDNTLTIPAKNTQFGALVGGQRDGTYNDDRNDYENTEVCIDYNAGLVGALGFINARLAPVTISCGANACRQPSLGPDFSTCGTSFPYTLNSNTPTASNVTFTWKRLSPSPATLVTSSSSANTFSVTSAMGAGTYVVIRDSSLTPDPGSCSKSDTIVITSTLPTPVISPAGPLNLCSPSFINFTVTNSASFPGATTWQWSKGGSSITGATTTTLSNVRVAGTYRITANIGGCTATWDEESVTSSLPTPVDGCNTGTGTVNLSITNPGLNGTNYNWYATAVSATPLTGGVGTTTFTTPSISTTTTFYVQDMSAVNTTVGPPSSSSFGADQNWGCTNQHNLVFTATSNFTLKSFYLRGEYNNSNPSTVTIEILNSADVVQATFTSDANTTHPATGTSLQKYTFGAGAGVLINTTLWGSPLKMRLKNTSCVEVQPKWTQGGASYPYTSAGGIVTITGATTNGAASTSDYHFFYNWEISTGTSCDRIPVVATISGSCSLPVELINFYALNNNDHVYLSWTTAWEQNNEFFQVERSADGVNYTVLKQINGMGNSESVRNYSYWDHEPLFGTAYYRIAQYDMDGTVTYSHAIAMERKDDTQLSVVPNPFNNSASLQVKSGIQSPLQLKIMDVSGAVKLSSDEYETNETIILGEDLPKGLYIVQAIFNNTIYTTKMVKQ